MERDSEFERWLDGRPFRDNPGFFAAPTEDLYPNLADWVAAGKTLPGIKARLLAMLDDETDPVRRGEAATALGYLGDEEQAGGLIASLDRDVPMVASLAAEALGRLRFPLAIEPLCRATSRPENEVRASACTALGVIGGDRATACIEGFLDDPDPLVRAAATAAFAEGEGSP